MSSPVIRISEFDTKRPGYGLATVRILVANTSDLATIYTDEARTAQADNPQTLTSEIINGIAYGRWQQPLYTDKPYQLEINSVDRTGVQRPALTTLVDQDASHATVLVTGAQRNIALADHLARRVDVRDYGEFLAAGSDGASATTNTTTLNAAIGAAGALGAGFVELPSGTYQITSFSLPQGVILRGLGRGASILQSTLAGDVCTIGGDRAGLARLTLDGVTLVGASRGVYALDKDQISFDEVEIKRFETGVQCEGGAEFDWRNLFVANCVNGFRGRGVEKIDGSFAIQRDNRWLGGRIETCSAKAIELRHNGATCRDFVFRGVGFDSNTAKAMHIIGARGITLEHCWWLDNGDNITLEDGSPQTIENTVIGIRLNGGSMNGGTMTLSGTLESVSLRRMTLQDVTPTITTPAHPILIEDCREVSGIDLTAAGSAWMRRKTGDRGATSGLTTGSAATKTWGLELAAGQRVYLEARVVARQRNGTNAAFYHLAVSAHRPAASLAYDSQTANFTAGNIATGQTSGATARIVADSDSGTTGTLSLQDVQGDFVDNEIITDTGGGSATVNGAISNSNAALVGSVTKIRADQESDTDWAATFVANGPEIELQVTGDTDQTIEWVSDVNVVT